MKNYRLTFGQGDWHFPDWLSSTITHSHSCAQGEEVWST